MNVRHDRFLLAVALAAATAASGCGSEKAAAKPAKAVRIEAVTPHVHEEGSRYSANVEPKERVVAAFRVGGYVESICRRKGADGTSRSIQRGDAVSRGEVLARLRDVEYRASVAQADSQVSEAKASLGKARLDADRATKLYESKSLTKPEYDGAVAALEAAEARSAGAAGQLREVEQALKDVALRSPLDGVVLDRSLEVGQLVGSGSTGFVLADVSSVKAVLGVPDRVVKDMKVGDVVPVRTEILGSGEFRGTVSAIAPAADVQSRVFDVEVTIPNREGRLKPGMIASVEVPSTHPDEEAEGVPAVPLASVVKSEAGGYSVFVVEGSGDALVARSRRVELGGIVGNRIAVRQGLAVGERIVSMGSTLLVDGDAVRVIP